MKMEYVETVIAIIKNSPEAKDAVLYASVIIILLIYRKLRIGRWRDLLKESADYHKFHLSSISRDMSMNEKNRELAQALLWGITKQLPRDIYNGRGGRALWRSFLGDKTALNTCGSVYYQCARYYRFIDTVIIKLNDTLISTFYRIYFLESCFSPFAVLYMDLLLLFYIITKPETGTGRLYLEMRSGGEKRRK